MRKNEIIACVVENQSIIEAIMQNEKSDEREDFTVIEICDLVEQNCGIEIDSNDTLILGDLLHFFNGQTITHNEQKINYLSILVSSRNTRDCDCICCLGREAWDLGAREGMIKKTHPDLLEGFVSMQEETGLDYCH